MIRVEIEMSVPHGATDPVLTATEIVQMGLREPIADSGCVVHRLVVEQDDA